MWVTFFLGLFPGLLAGVMVTSMCRIGRQRNRLESRHAALREGIPPAESEK